MVELGKKAKQRYYLAPNIHEIEENVFTEGMTTKEYTVAVNNYLAGSDSYPQLAGAMETGEYSCCEELLIRFFEQVPIPLLQVQRSRI